MRKVRLNIIVYLCFLMLVLFNTAILPTQSFAQEEETTEEGGEEELAEEEVTEEGGEEEVAEEETVSEEDEYIDESYVDQSQDTNSLPEGFHGEVKDFDIAGFRIGMDYKLAIKTAKQAKYTVKNTEYKVPEYIRYNLDALCQRQNIFEPKSLEMCVDGFAKKAKLYYVSKLEMEKADTGEKINVFFTSTLTENLIYRIEYKIDLRHLKGDQKKYLYEREENRRAYWYYILEKYGKPNVEPNKWMYNPDDPMATTMTANFDGILLESQGMAEIDFVEGVKKARTTFKAIEFSF